LKLQKRELKMAKCVKSKRNGNIIRVSDEEAARLVKESDFAYAPKSEYRAYIAKTAEVSHA